MMPTIELIYSNDCPNVTAAREVLQSALREAGLPQSWSEHSLEDERIPPRLRSCGSPSILIDGVDVAQLRASPSDGANCRVYLDSAGKPSGAPDVATVLRALRAAAAPSERATPNLSRERVDSFARALLVAGGISSLTSEQVDLVRWLFGELAAGRPVSHEDLVRLVTRARMHMHQVQAASRWIEVDDTGSLVGFGGLTLRPTRHRLLLADAARNLWCALDGFLVLHALGRSVRIETRCPASGTVIEVDAGIEGLRRVEPRSVVMSLVIPNLGPARSVSDIRKGFCEFVNFYDSKRTARAAVAEEMGAILPLEDAFELARALMARMTMSS
jgi:alkylmercury lyase